jgi:hypothetical protein
LFKPSEIPKGEERKKGEKRQEKRQKERSTFINNPFDEALRKRNQ